VPVPPVPVPALPPTPDPAPPPTPEPAAPPVAPEPVPPVAGPVGDISPEQPRRALRPKAATPVRRDPVMGDEMSGLVIHFLARAKLWVRGIRT
jgi:hypothetical protein